ncbi:hypothetical protein PG991_005530 [Apiospora marii]|uniref:Uncharacterized protein n=1 Tax=Apiospora marii TaxID=335849 RepID=A0ABR1S9G1_9PEZI
MPDVLVARVTNSEVIWHDPSIGTFVDILICATLMKRKSLIIDSATGSAKQEGQGEDLVECEVIDDPCSRNMVQGISSIIRAPNLSLHKMTRLS